MTAQSVFLCELFQALQPFYGFSQNVKVLNDEIQNTKIPLLVTKSGGILFAGYLAPWSITRTERAGQVERSSFTVDYSDFPSGVCVCHLQVLGWRKQAVKAARKSLATYEEH